MISFLDLALSQPLVEYSPPGGPGYGQGVLIDCFLRGRPRKIGIRRNALVRLEGRQIHHPPPPQQANLAPHRTVAIGTLSHLAEPRHVSVHNGHVYRHASRLSQRDDLRPRRAVLLHEPDESSLRAGDCQDSILSSPEEMNWKSERRGILSIRSSLVIGLTTFHQIPPRLGGRHRAASATAPLLGLLGCYVGGGATRGGAEL